MTAYIAPLICHKWRLWRHAAGPQAVAAGWQPDTAGCPSLDVPRLRRGGASAKQERARDISPPSGPSVRSCRAGPFDLGEAMTVYIFDLRGLDKPTHTTPAKTGGLPRPHYSTNAEQRRRRAAAREAGGIDRIVLHQWAAEAEPPAQAGDHGDALVLACRAAGLSFYGTSRGIGGAPYHISVSATRRGSGVVALVWPRHEHTFHAGTENARSIGVGVMGRFERDEEGQTAPACLARWRGRWHSRRDGAGDDADAHLDTLSATPVPSAPGSDGWRMDGPRRSPAARLSSPPRTPKATASPPTRGCTRSAMASPRQCAGWLHVEPEWSTGKGQPWPDSWHQEVRRA